MKPSTHKGFREKIRANCRKVGTYKDEFEPLINRLADAYLRHAQLQELYEYEGSRPMVTIRTRSGPVTVKNPILDEQDRLSRLILEMEKELGLTPAALRRVNTAAMETKKEADNPLTAAILRFRQGA